MKTLNMLLLFLLISAFSIAQSPVQAHQEDDMKLHWQFDGDKLFVTLFSPAKGWVGFGINDSDAKDGTNMIMAHVKRNNVTVNDMVRKEDAFIYVGEAGGQSHISNIQGMEGNRGTTIMFSLDVTPKDELHYALQSNKEFFLTLAYSSKDDFSLKSVYEKTIKLEL